MLYQAVRMCACFAIYIQFIIQVHHVPRHTRASLLMQHWWNVRLINDFTNYIPRYQNGRRSPTVNNRQRLTVDCTIDSIYDCTLAGERTYNKYTLSLCPTKSVWCVPLMKAAASCRNVWYFKENIWLMISAREPWVMQPSRTSFFNKSVLYVGHFSYSYGSNCKRGALRERR